MDYKLARTTPILELVCPVCGKTFIPAALHVYKARIHGIEKKVCTWGCQMKHERENYRPDGRKRKGAKR